MVTSQAMQESVALRHVFLLHAARGPDGDEVSALIDSEPFEQKLHALWQAGCDAWPGVSLSASELVRQLALHLPEGPIAAFVDSVHAADLYLACACMRGVPAALLSFERKLLTQVPGFVSRIDTSPSFVDEVCQQLREKLFVAPKDELPKIADYSGRGPLALWLKVAACRTALNIKRQRSDVPLDDAPPERTSTGHAADAELDYLRQRYRDALRTALRDAIASLPSERRQVLRLYFMSGLSLEKIGALFRVHQTTVTRWIAAAREAILRETRRLVSERMHLSPTELDSLAGLLRSELDLGLSVLLEPERDSV